MNEKELCKGSFRKMNIPAIISFVLAVIFFIEYQVMQNDRWAATNEITMFQILFIVFLVLSVVFFFWMSGCSIVVTDKRVYGVGAFRKRVDLPLDMVSSVGSGIFNRMTVATSSGKISFWFLKNKAEIFQTITHCLLERQNNIQPTTIRQVAVQSSADELKKYKELLDSGVISQEEFDAKKSNLLGL